MLSFGVGDSGAPRKSCGRSRNGLESSSSWRAASWAGGHVSKGNTHSVSSHAVIRARIRMGACDRSGQRLCAVGSNSIVRYLACARAGPALLARHSRPLLPRAAGRLGEQRAVAAAARHGCICNVCRKTSATRRARPSPPRVHQAPAIMDINWRARVHTARASPSATSHWGCACTAGDYSTWKRLRWLTRALV